MRSTAHSEFNGQGNPCREFARGVATCIPRNPSLNEISSKEVYGISYPTLKYFYILFFPFSYPSVIYKLNIGGVKYNLTIASYIYYYINYRQKESTFSSDKLLASMLQNTQIYKPQKRGKKTTQGSSTLTKYSHKGSKRRYIKRYMGQGK